MLMRLHGSDGGNDDAVGMSPRRKGERSTITIIIVMIKIRGERERLFGSREREGKLKIIFPFYGKGTGIRKLLREGKGREI